jgi:hypothetical protein
MSKIQQHRRAKDREREIKSNTRIKKIRRRALIKKGA